MTKEIFKEADRAGLSVLISVNKGFIAMKVGTEITDFIDGELEQSLVQASVALELKGKDDLKTVLGGLVRTLAKAMGDRAKGEILNCRIEGNAFICKDKMMKFVLRQGVPENLLTAKQIAKLDEFPLAEVSVPAYKFSIGIESGWIEQVPLEPTRD